MTVDRQCLKAQRLEFEIPMEATRGGTRTLLGSQEPGQGGNGRACQIAEVGLIPKVD